MLHLFSKNRFHESVACAALLAGSITLQVMWIVNLLVVRIPFIAQLYSIVPSVGPISGMYLKAVLTFVLVFLIAALYWRGKDCSHHRTSLLNFFLFSTVIFFVMTLPFVYSFSVMFE
ncbi:MAG: hypothetical protein NTX72_03345 [Candidatus Uhrbacteria bacterium]|nr:hypothetical protein [Candidatus Uhrbacteria bacterium]